MQNDVARFDPRIASATVPLFLRRGGPDPGGDPGAEDETSRDHDLDAERAILCGSCGAPVTDLDAATAVAGNHAHTFFNPAGYRFEIGCFTRAPGCVNLGIPTDEFSWFPGYRWSFSACGGCGNHLGWRFSSDDGGLFWGLILKELKRPE